MSPRGVHPASLANLRRGNVTTPTKRARKPKTNSPEHMQMMNRRRRELAEARRREQEERLAALAPVVVEVAPAREPAPFETTRAPERLEDYTETPVVRRTVTLFNEWTMVGHGSMSCRRVGRVAGSNPFVRRIKVATHPVVRAVVNDGRLRRVVPMAPGPDGWPRPVADAYWARGREIWWCPALDALVDTDQLDPLPSPPDEGPTDGDRRAALAEAQRPRLLGLPQYRTGQMCDLLGKSDVSAPGMGEREPRYRVPWDREHTI